MLSVSFNKMSNTRLTYPTRGLASKQSWNHILIPSQSTANFGNLFSRIVHSHGLFVMSVSHRTFNL